MENHHDQYEFELREHYCRPRQRKTYRKDGIEDLASNIRADGFRLLRNIVIRKSDKRGEGVSIADIAAGFATTETTVKRRLALAQVSPSLLELYGNGETDFEHPPAFAVSNDDEKQEPVLESFPSWNGISYGTKAALHRVAAW